MASFSMLDILLFFQSFFGKSVTYVWQCCINMLSQNLEILRSQQLQFNVSYHQSIIQKEPLGTWHFKNDLGSDSLLNFLGKIENVL